MKKIFLIILGLIGIIAVFLIGQFIYFANNYANKGASPEYYRELENRIHIKTTKKIPVLQEQKKVEKNINAFFLENKYLLTPDSLNVSYTICSGCSIIEKAIYFETEPRETYIVNFELDGGAYIDKIYRHEKNKTIELQCFQINKTEKLRIKNRVEKEVIMKIDFLKEIKTLHNNK